MIVSMAYGSLANFYQGNREEINIAVGRAREAADRWIHRLPCGLDGDAFRGEAVLAVWLAALAYRPELGVPFAAWAALAVDYALLQERRRQDWVSERRRRQLHAGVVEAQASDLQPESLQGWLKRFGEGRAAWEVDCRPGPEAQVLRSASAAYILAQVLALTHREREVLLLRFWEGRTLAEIGETLGVSSARAGQIVQGAVMVLRRRFGADGVHRYGL